MNSTLVFCKTVQGYNHLIHSPILPCEDSSGVFVDPLNRFSIIIVADGHGDHACPRSAFGSKTVVDVAIQKLRVFAEEFLQFEPNEQYRLFGIPKNRDLQIKKLTDEIIASWQHSVLQDITNNPLTDDEIKDCGKYAVHYQQGMRLEHVYGTTLIAALQLPEYLVLIQQGDGRCDIIYSDGSIEQPIPWDERCFENVCTSMCDSDVTTSIRHYVINLDEQPVVACFMGSDGIEDSYPYEPIEGTHTFFRELCMRISEDANTIDDFLADYLPGFSQQGSGDDISVAGIVDIAGIIPLIEDFKKRINQYQLIDKKVFFEGKINSMKRKHGILAERKDLAQKNLENINEQLLVQEDRIQEATDELNAISTRVNEIKKILDEKTDIKNRMIEEESHPSTSLFSLLSQKMTDLAKCVRDGVSAAFDQTQQDYQDTMSTLSNQQLKLETLTQEKKDLESKKEQCIIAYKKSVDEYSEYDEKYRLIESQLQEIIRQMNMG